jgi:hypothetical protein
MYRFFVPLTLLALTACATSPIEPPVAAFAPSGSPVVSPSAALPSSETAVAANSVSAEPVADVESIDIEELDNGLVCEYEKRPGSRIEKKYCYTREERAAYQAARDQQVRQQMNALSLEQEQRAAWERELARQRSPSGIAR